MALEMISMVAKWHSKRLVMVADEQIYARWLSGDRQSPMYRANDEKQSTTATDERISMPTG